MREKLPHRFKRVLRNKGIKHLLWAILKNILNATYKFFSYYQYKALKSKMTFKFNGKEFYYFCHKDGATWLTERAIEIPIIWDIIKKNKDKPILELGNVLSHYFPVKSLDNYKIIDKFEEAEGIINTDIVDYSPKDKFDFIISISTLEHVGFDENVLGKSLNEPKKIMGAINNMKKMLSQNGKIIITIPIGYNPGLDLLIANKIIKFNEIFCMKRVSRDNKWIKAEWNEIKNMKYNFPFPLANGLIIGTIARQ